MIIAKGVYFMEIIRKKQRQLFISFLLTIALFIGLIIGLFLTSWSIDLKLSLLLVSLIVMLVVLFWFKPRLFYYDQQYGFLKMKSLQGKPLSTSFDLSSQQWVLHLRKKNFTVFASNEAYAVFHRFTRDATNFLTKRPMLEIIAILYKDSMNYHDQEISKIINLIEDDYLRRKVKFTNYTILQIKFGDDITKDIEQAADQVVFDNQAGRHITVVNGYFIKNQKEVYFLYSDFYTPTAFYRHGIELMKELI